MCIRDRQELRPYIEEADQLTVDQSPVEGEVIFLSLIHISEPTRQLMLSRMPSSAGKGGGGGG
ncbi:hypothetical protein, partial [Bacillus pumilus]|uniref:hypothetical protein n=1 Tax=Bacillus pumilus TaxID=1408 RepID=UPI001C9BAB62